MNSIKNDIQIINEKLANLNLNEPNQQPDQGKPQYVQPRRKKSGYEENFNHNPSASYINNSNIQNQSQWRVENSKHVGKAYPEEEKTPSNSDFIKNNSTHSSKARIDKIESKIQNNMADSISQILDDLEPKTNIKDEIKSINQIVDNEIKDLEKQSAVKKNVQDFGSTSLMEEPIYANKSVAQAQVRQAPVVQQSKNNINPDKPMIPLNRPPPQQNTQYSAKNGEKNYDMPGQDEYQNQDDFQTYNDQHPDMRYDQNYSQNHQNYSNAYNQNAEDQYDQ